MICQACGAKEGKFHVTVSIVIFGIKTTRQKRVTFIVCEDCDLAMQQVLCKDDQLKYRMAHRLVKAPEFMSESQVAWRRKKSAENYTEWVEKHIDPGAKGIETDIDLGRQFS